MRHFASLNNPFLRCGAIAYFSLKRHWYQWRYPNLSLAPGVMIRGRLKITGSVQVAIGAQSRLGKKVEIFGSGKLSVGENVSLNGCSVGCQSEIAIGNDCLISDCYLLDTDYHNLDPRLRHLPPGPKTTAPIVIEDNVWIGANSTVMKGVRVGRDSVIGLGSVIRKSVPAGVVAIGNPQQIVKRFEYDAYGQRLPESPSLSPSPSASPPVSKPAPSLTLG